SRRRHTRWPRDWSSDVCSSDLGARARTASGIPDKGRVLTALTRFWLERLRVPNHLLDTDPAAMGAAFAAQKDTLAGRTMLVRKTDRKSVVEGKSGVASL